MRVPVFNLVVFIAALVPIPTWAQDTVTVVVSLVPDWGEHLELVEELRLGMVEGPPHLSWGLVTGFAEDSQGVIYIIDGMARAIYQFSAAGEFLGNVGRVGEGPGEYRDPSDIAVALDGRLFVQDALGNRVTVYGPDRRVLGDFRAVTNLMAGSGTFQVDREGNSYVRGAVGLSAPLTRTAAQYPPYQWVKYGSEGEVIDSIRAPAADPGGPHYTLITSEGRRSPFTVLNVSVLSPAGYLVWGRNDRYALHWRLPNGSIAQLLLSRPRVDVTRGEERQWEAQSERFRRSPLGEEYPAIPDTKPHFRRVLADSDGRLWVERYVEPFEYEYSPDELAQRGDRPPYTWREPQVFDVIDPRGRLLGVVRLPPRTQFLDARADHVWVVQLGNFDIRYVVKYVIVPG